MSLIKKIVLWTFKPFCLFLFLFILIFFVPRIIEEQNNNKKIKIFMNKGIYNKEISNNSRKVFIVPRETNKDKKSIYIVDDTYYLGTDGDIILTNYLAFVNNIPFVSELCDFLIGGHASIVFGNKRYESVGYGKKQGVLEIDNHILNTNTKELIGLRVSNANNNEISLAKSFVLNNLGKKYNKTYLFNKKNSFYCTDLVVRAYGSEANLNYNLDHDGFLVTTHDIIYSDYTEIFFYSFIKSGIKYYYILN